MTSKAQGFILVTTLIFLLVLTLLMLSASENVILETKMSDYYQNNLITQSAAESELMIAEGSLIDKSVSVPANNVMVNYQITAQGTDACQRSNYLINVTAIYQQAQSHLQSLYQVVPKAAPPTCDDKPMISERLWWQQF